MQHGLEKSGKKALQVLAVTCVWPIVIRGGCHHGLLGVAALGRLSAHGGACPSVILGVESSVIHASHHQCIATTRLVAAAAAVQRRSKTSASPFGEPRLAAVASLAGMCLWFPAHTPGLCLGPLVVLSGWPPFGSLAPSGMLGFGCR